jgi:hypothetical protein
MADKTKNETATPSTPTDLTQAGTSRKRRAFTKKRGPRVFVKYEVVDGSGNVIPGAVARLLRVERDQTKILEMTLNHTLDGQYMMVDVPINLTAEKGETEAEPNLAQAAE